MQDHGASDRDPSTDGRVRRAKLRFGQELKTYPNVTGVGVGYRIVGRQRRDEICLRVYVRTKVPESALAPDEILPKAVDGVSVDVIEADWWAMAPNLTIAERQSRHPLEVYAGVSIGGLRVTAGTLGAAVSDLGSGELLLLSNWHVLCGDYDCRPGEPIIQPGVYDGGLPDDGIAHVKTFAINEDVDAACATVSPARYLLRDLAGLPGFRGIATATRGMRIWKSGRTTGVTTGVVEDIDADVEVSGYPEGIREFRDQIIAVTDGDTPIVRGGDSGSLVVNGDELAVGLLFGGERKSGSYFIANHISAVISNLAIELPPQQTHVEATPAVTAIG
jgi:hypothetical protein